MRKRPVSSRLRGMFGALGFRRREERRKAQSLKRRELHFEPLEERQLLTVLIWDPNKSGGSNLGGQGTWANGGDNVWWDSTRQQDVAWATGTRNVAVFEGTAGTVTVDSGVSVSVAAKLGASFAGLGGQTARVAIAAKWGPASGKLGAGGRPPVA